jgi:hypothetical protein
LAADAKTAERNFEDVIENLHLAALLQPVPSIFSSHFDLWEARGRDYSGMFL